MSAKPYDATSRTLFHEHAEDIAAYLGYPNAQAVPLDTDLSTITSQADGVFAFRTDASRMLHIEVVAGHIANLIEREFAHNILIWARYNVPVHSFILILKPEAHRQSYTGVYKIMDGDQVLAVFHYVVIAVWKEDPDKLLARLGTMPLAVLTVKSQDDLPALLDKMERRLEDQPREVVDRIVLAAGIYGGMLFPDNVFFEYILKRHPTMRESSTYQAILKEGEAKGRAEGRVEGRVEGEAKGRVEGEAKAILRIGTQRFLAPNESQRQAIAGASEAQLERMLDNLYQAADWDDLLRRGL